MGLFSESRKFIERFFFIIRMLIISFFMWKLDWFSVWITRRKNVVKVKGSQFKIRNDNLVDFISDLAVIFEVFVYHEYGICKIGKDDVVIDIGAHIGSFSVYASKKASGGKVFSFEPFKGSYDQLCENIRLNKAENVTLINKAIGKEEKVSVLYLGKNKGENSLYKKTGQKMIVKATTLKNVFKDNKIKACDVLKLDCEGGEYDILFSSKDELKQIKRIIMEYHMPEYFGLSDIYSFDMLVKYLEENGFKVKVDRLKFYQGILYARK